MTGTKPRARAWPRDRLMPKRLFTNPPVPPPPRGRSIRRALLAMVAGMLLVPIARDATALSVARWRSMDGQAVAAETPVFDTLGDAFEQLASQCRLATSWLIQDPPWRPTLAFSLIFAWVAGAAWFLRRG